MDAARYVGRVGALAVALGIGTALFVGVGDAWADGSGGSSAGGPMGKTSSESRGLGRGGAVKRSSHQVGQTVVARTPSARSEGDRTTGFRPESTASTVEVADSSTAVHQTGTVKTTARLAVAVPAVPVILATPATAASRAVGLEQAMDGSRLTPQGLSSVERVGLAFSGRTAQQHREGDRSEIAAGQLPTTGALVDATAQVAAAPSWSPSPFSPISKVLVGLLLSLGGMNWTSPNPSNAIQQFVYSVAKRINDVLDPAPEPGTPTVGIPNLTTGVVTGSLGFPAGNGLTFTTTQPATGTVVVASDGTFTYTPTQSARQAAGLSTTDTFTATVHEGLSASSVSVTVLVDPGTPVAGIPTVGTPDQHGNVTGTAAFTDTAGRSLTYSAPTTTTGGGTVSIDTSTGAFTYSPTQTQRLNAGANTTDTFTVTATTDVRSATETLTVAVDPGTPVAGTPIVGTPNSSTGVVAGSAVFIDTAGRSLTYSAPATSSGGGTVSIDPGTGAFTYTPSLAARNASATTGANVDTFTVTATNGVRSTTETVAVPVVPTDTYVTFNLVFGSGTEYWSLDARSAFQSAANYLASYLLVSSSVTITVDFFGGSSAYAPISPGRFSSGWETAAQTKILTGVDTNGSAADSTVVLSFNPINPPLGALQSVAMHELIHGLGFFSYLSSPNPGEYWSVYDTFLTDADGDPVIGNGIPWDGTYAANLTGGNGGLYLGGPNAVTANGGLVKVYTPSSLIPGGSVNHLDDPVPHMMNPNPGGARVLSSTEVGILKDLGYSVVPQPALAGFLFINLGLLSRKRSRSRLVLGLLRIKSATGGGGR